MFYDIFIIFTIAGFLFCYYYFFKIAVLQEDEKDEKRFNPKIRNLSRSQKRRIWKKSWENYKH